MVSIRGERVREFRTSLGISQSELAEKLGVNQFQVSRYERGSSNPSVDVLVVMAQIFDTTTDYLLGLSDQPRSGASADELHALAPTEAEMVALMRHYDVEAQKRLVELVRLTQEISLPRDT